MEAERVKMKSVFQENAADADIYFIRYFFIHFLKAENENTLPLRKIIHSTFTKEPQDYCPSNRFYTTDTHILKHTNHVVDQANHSRHQL